MVDSLWTLASRTVRLLQETEHVLDALHEIAPQISKPEIEEWKTAIKSISNKARKGLQSYLAQSEVSTETASTMTIGKAMKIFDRAGSIIPDSGLRHLEDSINASTNTDRRKGSSKPRTDRVRIVETGAPKHPYRFVQ